MRVDEYCVRIMAHNAKTKKLCALWEYDDDPPEDEPLEAPSQQEELVHSSEDEYDRPGRKKRRKSGVNKASEKPVNCQALPKLKPLEVISILDSDGDEEEMPTQDLCKPLTELPAVANKPREPTPAVAASSKRKSEPASQPLVLEDLSAETRAQLEESRRLVARMKALSEADNDLDDDEPAPLPTTTSTSHLLYKYNLPSRHIQMPLPDPSPPPEQPAASTAQEQPGHAAGEPEQHKWTISLQNQRGNNKVERKPVKVWPHDPVSKLLQSFIVLAKQHPDVWPSVPSDHSRYKLGFDGSKLQLTETLQDAGLEHGDVVDISWS